MDTQKMANAHVCPIQRSESMRLKTSPAIKVHFIFQTKVGRYLVPDRAAVNGTGVGWIGGLHMRIRFDYSAEAFERQLEDTLARSRLEDEMATQLAAFTAIEDGQTIRGRLIGSTQLFSGRFAMIDDGLGFSLVPWRPVIEKEIGREVIGVMRGTDVSWQLGRKLGLGI